MELSFSRMNGLGNRFAIIDNRPLALTEAQQASLAGEIEGLDQLLLLEPPRGEGDLFMAIYNKDGSQAKACGNGVRCVAWLALEAMNQTSEPKRDFITIETLGGLVACRKRGEDIEANMGAARWQWDSIPLAEPRDTLNIRLADTPPSLGLGTAVNVGNPHIIFFPNELSTEASFDWRALGQMIEHDALFPEGVNVSFARVRNEGLELKVWERGAGATKACGTAACAAAVAACRRFPVMPRALPVKLSGGVLEIQWRQQDNQVLMTGAVAWDGTDSIHV